MPVTDTRKAGKHYRRRPHPSEKVVLCNADIDKGILTVVEWLNGLNGVTTMYSCQGYRNSDKRNGVQPYVVFTCYNELSLHTILHMIRRYRIVVKVEWQEGQPMRYNMTFGIAMKAENLALDGKTALKRLTEKIKAKEAQ